MGWFRFKGRDSRDFGILLSSAPQRTRAERRVEHITIPGRNGDLTQDEETYEPYTISMECSTRGSDRLDEIVTWLNGAGELVLFTEPNRKMQASIYNKISIADVIYLYNAFLLRFRAQPFKYSTNPINERLEYDGKDSGEDHIIHNKGTVYSEPTITVYGSGDVQLAINDAEMLLKNIDGHITIDSEMMEVYKDGENANSKFSSSDGFPKFRVGENVFRIAGTVEKIVIDPKWRWL